MPDNFNFKQFLAENKLGAYSKANEAESMQQDVLKEMQAQIITSPNGTKLYQYNIVGSTLEGLRPVKLEIYDNPTENVIRARIQGELDLSTIPRESIKAMGTPAALRVGGKAVMIGNELRAKLINPTPITEESTDENLQEATSPKVQGVYEKITSVISKVAKKLSEDEVHELHEKLKAFFNAAI